MECAHFEWDGVPDKALRGNQSVARHWRVSNSAKKSMQDMAIAMGRDYVNRNPDTEFPLTGDLYVEFTITTPRRVDFENLIFSYKPFIDGLQEKMAGGGVGAGVIRNDSDIRCGDFILKKGPEHTRLHIRAV